MSTLAGMWPVIDGLRTLELGFVGEQRDWLTGLVLHGAKRATAGLLAEYEEENEPHEQIGEKLVLVDNDGAEIGRVQVTRVEVVRFADVPWEFAAAEAEGDESIEEWREGHRRHWAKENREITDDTEVVCIWFDLL